MKDVYIVREKTMLEYTDFRIAEEEAKRLAQLSPGKEYYVLIPLSKIKVESMKVEHSESFGKLFDTIQH